MIARFATNSCRWSPIGIVLVIGLGVVALTNAKDQKEIKTNPRDWQASNKSEDLNERLFEAVKKGDAAGMKDLLQKGADINGKDKDGTTPLLQAVSLGQIEIVKILIEKGANVNASNGGLTLLMSAGLLENKELSASLMALLKKAEAHLTEPEELLYAAKSGDCPTLDALIAKGRDVNARVGIDDDADGSVAASALDMAILEGRMEALDLLLKKGAKVDVFALAIAAGIENKAFWKALQPMVKNLRPQEKSKALRIAVHDDNALMAGRFLDEGVDPNFWDKHFEGTPLLRAVEQGSPKMVEMLLVKGAGKYPWASTPVGEFAGRKPPKQRASTDGVVALTKAAQEGKLEMVRLLVGHGFDVNAKEDWGVTALLSAVANSKIDVVQWLLDKDADVNAASEDGSTPLTYAIGSGQETLVKLLVDHGADVNAVGGGWTDATDRGPAEPHDCKIFDFQGGGCQRRSQGWHYRVTCGIARGQSRNGGFAEKSRGEGVESASCGARADGGHGRLLDDLRHLAQTLQTKRDTRKTRQTQPIPMNPDIRWKQRFQNFDRAFVLLRQALERGPSALSALEKEGVIQRFEYSFELAWKTVKDFLEEGGLVISPITPRQVLKDAFAAKVLPDGQVWIDMLDQRNLLSHSYDIAVFEKAVDAIAARYLSALGELHKFFISKKVE